MLKSFTFSALCLLLFSYCTQEKFDIRVVCEATPSGYYLIKWETFPPMEGSVKIYESAAPDSFYLNSSVVEADINKSFVKDIFFVKPTKRSYFKLVFNKKKSVVTAERNISMQGLSNFRDLGGYFNSDGKQTRWGKLYRSSSLAGATFQDAKVLKNLNIRTVIDFRTDRERFSAPSKFLASRIFNFPLRGNPYNIYFDRIMAKKMKAGDVKIYAQDMFAFLLQNNSDFFIEMFDVLLDENNYPVLVNCSQGRDRSALASALILAALDIDMDQIVGDYMLTNDQTDFNLLVSDTSNLFFQDPEIQETFTAYFRVHKSTINHAFDLIIKEYGTLDNYFNTVLQLTPKKRERLKEIMLY